MIPRGFFLNKICLHEFFSSSGFNDIRIVRLFLFLTVWTYFSSNCFENVWGDCPQYLELESVEILYDIYNRLIKKYGEERFLCF